MSSNENVRGLRYWMRAVGGFYLLLGLLDNPWSVAARLPYQYPNLDVSVDSVAARALVDTWFLIGIEGGVIGAGLLYLSRNPERHLGLVWVVIFLEALRGIGHDMYVIARGQDPVFFSVFAMVHLLIIVTGVRAVRGASTAGGQLRSSPAPQL